MRELLALSLTLLIVTSSPSEGNDEVKQCSLPSTLTLLAINTADGAQLTYKHSAWPTASTVLFDGFNISSNGCGEMFERCSITVISWDDITLAALPLGHHFGLVTFNNDSARNQFTFREKLLIDTTSLELDCDLTALFNDTGAPSALPTLLAVCFYDGMDRRLVDVIFVPLNLSTLAASEQPGIFSPMCLVTNPSNFIYLRSSRFRDGAIVFVDQGTVLLHKSEGCEEERSDVCTDVERFVPISSIHQAIYCSARTYLIDLAGDVTFPTFSPSEDGVLMFCSSDIYCAYRDNNLTLRAVSDKAALRVPVEFPYEEEVLRGDCVAAAGEFFVVVQLRNDIVIAVNLNRSETIELGVSVTPPRLFEHSVLLQSSTSAVVFGLLDMRFGDSIVGSFVLGAVVNGADIPVPCMSTSSTSPSPVTTVVPATLGLPVYAIALIAVVGGVLVIVACIILLLLVEMKQRIVRSHIPALYLQLQPGPIPAVDPQLQPGPIPAADPQLQPGGPIPAVDPQLQPSPIPAVDPPGGPIPASAVNPLLSSAGPGSTHDDTAPETTLPQAGARRRPVRHDQATSSPTHPPQTTTDTVTVTTEDVQRHREVENVINRADYLEDDHIVEAVQHTQENTQPPLLIPHGHAVVVAGGNPAAAPIADPPIAGSPPAIDDDDDRLPRDNNDRLMFDNNRRQ